MSYICTLCGQKASFPENARNECVPGRKKEHTWHEQPQEQDGIELQLLIIDMGDYCVVKAEKKNEGVKLIIGQYGYNLPQGDVDLIQKPFTDIRAAIDAMNDKPPVPPYLIRSESRGYVLIDTYDDISEEMYISLSALAGHPLPIYEPRQRGEWVKLPAFDWTNARKEVAQGGYSIDTESFEDSMAPVKLWRYTRMREK